MSFADSFLTCPDLFPARRGGEPWGDEELRCGFVGGAYHLTGLAAAQHEAIAARFGAFPAPAGVAVRLDVFRAAEEDFLPIPLDGREYRLDVDYAPRAVRLAGHRLIGLLEWREEGLAAALWTSTVEAGAFAEALENVLRVVAAYRVVENGGVLVHSAAIAWDDGACLFPGRSGAGKSTLSGLAAARGLTVLSDELNALTAGRPAEVEQVPFAGDHGQSRRVEGRMPLVAVCRLRQAATDDLRPLGPGETAAQLVAASPYLNRDPYRASAAEEILAAVASATPGWELSFRRDSDLAVLGRLRLPQEVSP